MSRKSKRYHIEKPIGVIHCNCSYIDADLVIINISDGMCESGFALDGDPHVVDRKMTTPIHFTDDERMIVCRNEYPFDITHLCS